MTIPGEPLTKCPVCKYDLTGLPANHRCPECAFEYDETTRIWESPLIGSRRVRRYLLPSLGICFFVTTRSIIDFARGDPDYGFRLTMAAILLGAVAIAAFVHLRARPFVLIDKHGILFRKSRGGTQRFAWREIWIPRPEERLVVPPWARGHVDRKTAGLTQWFGNALFNGHVYLGSASYIYPRPESEFVTRTSVVLPLMEHPRCACAAAMAEIHRRWSEQETRSSVPDTGVP